MRKEAFILAIALVLFVRVASANSAPSIQELESEILVCEGSSLSYFFPVTDAEDGEMTFGISPDSPFYIRSTSSNTATTNAEIFSGNITKDQANIEYPLTVFVFDEGKLIDTQDISVSVLEINNPPVVSHISVKTILLNGALTEYLSVYDLESGTNPSKFYFEVSSDLNDSNLSITNTGFLSFKPSIADLGVHTVTVCVTDSGIENIESKIGFCGSDIVEEKTCQTFQLAVTEINTPPTILLHNSSINMSAKILGTERLTFEVYKFDPEGIIPETLWYVDKVLKKVGKGNAEDRFSYTFGCEVSGRHTIEAVVTDGSLNDSVIWNFDLFRSACFSDAPQQPIIGDQLCEETWGCSNWNVCQDLEQSTTLGLISSEDNKIISEQCSSTNLVPSECGFQIRTCADLNACSTQSKKPTEIQACKFVLEPSCSDGIKNCHDGACEFLVDCGGPCGACPICSDGIQNQAEEGIDCGGPCFEKCPVKIISESEKSAKQYVSYAIVILIVVSVVQIAMIVHQKKKLEQPSKRGVNNVQDNH